MTVKKNKKYLPLNKARLDFLAMRYVARYAATRAMLGRVLQRHIQKAVFMEENFDAEQAQQWMNIILDRCEEKGWINDALFAQSVVGAGSRKGLSQMRIKMKLQNKGIGKEMISQTMDEARDDKSVDEMDYDAALVFAKKKKLGAFGDPSVLKDLAKMQKQLAKMCRAGFSPIMARKILNLSADGFED